MQRTYRGEGGGLPAAGARAPVPDQQTSAAAAWIGHVFAGHRIDALVGEGGMGVVFRATHLQLGRTVALKVLSPQLAADPEYRRRFAREAAIAASLEHPNVVPIYDAGHVNGMLYLSMRFVDGVDLGVVLQHEGRLGVDRVCALLGPVADALDAVHEAGLVHRDVKPANILLARSRRPGAPQQVYLCDFGIAKGAAAVDSEITSAGQYMGTLQYSSPEQIEGRWLDGRTDQYGLACLAYRSLTGQVPYPRQQTAAVVYAHLTAEPPRPTEYRPDLPPAVDAVIARGTAKHPDHRFPSCSAFIAALYEAGRPAPRPRPTPPTVPIQDRQGSGPQRSPAPQQPASTQPPSAQPTPTPSSAPGPSRTPSPAPRPPATKPLPEPANPSLPTRRAERDELITPEPRDAAVPAPVEVSAERGPDERSITVTWTAGGPQEAEYKITRLTADGRWQVVGRTRSTSIVDGAVAPGQAIPVYGVVARLGTAVSEPARSAETASRPDPSRPAASRPDPSRPAASQPDPSRPAASQPDPSRPAASQPDPSRPAASQPDPARSAASPTPSLATDRGSVAPQPAASPAVSSPAGDGPAPDGGPAADFPAVQHLVVAASGTLEFEWPRGITEAMVVVRQDRPPTAPDDPGATAWKITNMRYQIDGGLLLPASVDRPCHVAVASCRRDNGTLVVAPGFDPTARTTVDA